MRSVIQESRNLSALFLLFLLFSNAYNVYCIWRAVCRVREGVGSLPQYDGINRSRLVLSVPSFAHFVINWKLPKPKSNSRKHCNLRAKRLTVPSHVLQVFQAERPTFLHVSKWLKRAFLGVQVPPIYICSHRPLLCNGNDNVRELWQFGQLKSEGQRPKTTLRTAFSSQISFLAGPQNLKTIFSTTNFNIKKFYKLQSPWRKKIIKHTLKQWVIPKIIL